MCLFHRSVVLVLLGLIAACHGTRDPAPTEIVGQTLPACSAPAMASDSRSSGTWGITLRTEADIPAALQTRNPQLAEQLARVTARELSATGVRCTFSPTIAVARDIRWGRTYESFGEDVEQRHAPFLPW